MKFDRLVSALDSRYPRAMELYKVSFPEHEQRTEQSLADALKHKDYHFNLIYDDACFVGLILYWDMPQAIYVEHFCIATELRNRNYGQRSLELLKETGKRIILEIDPISDEISSRRKGFYERVGFQENPYKHVHPPYHPGKQGHELIVMSFPDVISQEMYDGFRAYLEHTQSVYLGTQADIDEIARLYDDLNDYLTSHTNYPGWIKGIYPVRETAVSGIEEGTLYIVRRGGCIAGTFILNHKPEDGYGTVNWPDELEEKDVFIIHTLALHPLYLKHGMGMEIMEWIINYCRMAGGKAIRLDTYEKNIPAIQLYQKCGFQYIDTVDLGYGESGLDYFKLYQKNLSE